MLAATRPNPLIALVAALALIGCGDRDVRVEHRFPSAQPGAAEPSQGSDVAGWVEVTALHADGTPARDATAYAVRAGRTSKTSTPDWPEADVDAAGRARIPVPAAGVYDVGVIFPSREEPRALVTDVQVAAGTTTKVEVRLPELAPVDVVIEDEVPGRIALYATERIAARSRESYYPARGESSAVRWSFHSPLTSVMLPAGVAFELWPQEQGADGKWRGMGADFEATPAVVVPPGRVVLRRRTAPEPEMTVPLRLKVEGSVPVAVESSRLRLRFAEGTAEEAEYDIAVRWKNGVPEAEALTIAPRDVDSKLTWSGEGVVSGEALLPAASHAKDGAAAPIEILIRGDGVPYLEGIDVVGGRQPPRSDSPFLHAQDPTNPRAHGVGIYTEHQNRMEDLRPGWLAVAEWGAWWVSKPTAVPVRGRLQLTLVPGGYLLATSARVPTRGLGALTIRRADGAWLGERTAYDIEDDDCDGESAGGARPGMILGPLPEGDVELIVSLGGEERTRIVARVRANAITPFALTW